MPEERTRKLLKLFGMALTEFEDETKAILERLQALESPGAATAPTLDLAEKWLTMNGQVMARWLEVTQLLVEAQTKVQAELRQAITAGRQARG